MRKYTNQMNRERRHAQAGRTEAIWGSNSLWQYRHGQHGCRGFPEKWPATLGSSPTLPIQLVEAGLFLRTPPPGGQFPLSKTHSLTRKKRRSTMACKGAQARWPTHKLTNGRLLPQDCVMCPNLLTKFYQQNLAGSFHMLKCYG